MDRKIITNLILAAVLAFAVPVTVGAQEYISAPVTVLKEKVKVNGNIAEMKTGEGKTLTETLPTYLNALSGKGVHIITVNEFLIPIRKIVIFHKKIKQFLYVHKPPLGIIIYWKLPNVTSFPQT